MSALLPFWIHALNPQRTAGILIVPSGLVGCVVLFWKHMFDGGFHISGNNISQ